MAIKDKTNATAAKRKLTMDSDPSAKKFKSTDEAKKKGQNFSKDKNSEFKNRESKKNVFQKDAKFSKEGKIKKPLNIEKFKAGKSNGKLYSKSTGKPLEKKKPVEKKPEVPLKKKDLKKERRQKKLGSDYDIHTNMKKIWETLRRSDTTDEAKKKLCTSLYDSVTGKINQMAFAHDTCRVIECLVQYGNERHRTGVFEELKESFVELSKSKYARFMIKKLLLYCNTEQKDFLIKAFMGKIVKLIKHSFACQVVETIYNEHANNLQRSQMQMEFYDPTFAILNHQTKHKSLKDVLEAQPLQKEKILTNIKTILNSCVTKTLLMFSLIHKIFLEYFINCDQKDKLEMIDTLTEHLVNMVHTKDGTEVALQCVWFGSAKERKKIIKAMKSFVLKIAIEEHGHKVLVGLFDSVDDTKLVAKSILEELFRSTKELFDNEYGRKVVTYLVAPRDTRFFIKDYTKRLENGDASETKKKDPELRKKELLDYAKPFLKDFLNKEIANLLFNGAGGVLIPVVLKELGSDGNDIIKKIADQLLKTRYEITEEKNTDADAKSHPIEDATVHYICKQVLSGDAERQKNCLKTLADSLLEHENSLYIRYWVECNRGCFTLVQLIEASTDVNKKKVKIILDGVEKQLSASKNSGANVLLKKLQEIK